MKPYSRLTLSDLKPPTFYMKIERHFEDISFFVVMEGKKHDGRIYYVDFKAYEVLGWSDYPRRPLFYKKNWTSSTDSVDSYYEAAFYLRGSIKSDGCSNMSFTDEVMLHFCGRKDLNNLNQLLLRLYDMAAEIMPDSKEDLQ